MFKATGEEMNNINKYNYDFLPSPTSRDDKSFLMFDDSPGPKLKLRHLSPEPKIIEKKTTSEHSDSWV